jgi:hypothetical protein
MILSIIGLFLILISFYLMKYSEIWGGLLFFIGVAVGLKGRQQQEKPPKL